MYLRNRTANRWRQRRNQTLGTPLWTTPRNQDGIGEKELLVVSFGTSYNDNRRLTIGAIENAMEEAFPEYAVRRGFYQPDYH